MKRSLLLIAAGILLGGLLMHFGENRVRRDLSAAAHAQEVRPEPKSSEAPLETIRPRPKPPAEQETFTPDERVNIAVYENCRRSVVNINTRSTRAGNPFFDEESNGMGSGSVLDKRGHILTNYHVVEGAREIQVTLDGKSYEARPVGADPPNDIAIVRIDAPADALHPVVFGDSARLRVGQRVFAIGNPFGLERTFSTGVVSSLNRTIPSRDQARTIKSVIQIDAAINPGNSGGPLLNSRGRLIGMNTAIASRTGQSAGVGFAIPVNTIARIVPQLIEKGHVERPDHGIAQVYETDRGLLLAALVPGGPAEHSGLRGITLRTERKRQGAFVYEFQRRDVTTADLVVSVEGQAVNTADEFLTLIESRRPGDEVNLVVIREGRETPVKLKLGKGQEGE